MAASDAAERLGAILDDWAAAVRARDIEGVLRHHADDILMFDVVGPVRERGSRPIGAAGSSSYYPWHGESGRFALSDVAVTAGARAGFATALIDCAGTEAGRAVAFTLRLTVGFEKRGGNWVVVHEHHSEPVPVPAAAGTLAAKPLAIERDLWKNDAAAYAAAFLAEAVLTFPEIGRIGLAEALAAIRAENAGGRRWAEVTLDDVAAAEPAAGTALLTYTARARWNDAAAPERVLCSTLYLRRPSGWKVAAHQQTAG